MEPKSYLSPEQLVLLQHFLEKAEAWVQSFVWDLSDNTRLVRLKAEHQLTDMQWQLERRIAEKPGPDVVDKLSKHLAVILKAQRELKEATLGPQDLSAMLLGNELLGPVMDSAGRWKPGKVNVQLSVGVPGRVVVVFESDVFGAGQGEATPAGRVGEDAERAVVPSAGPEQQSGERLRRRTYLKVMRQPQNWYLSIAPQSEGWTSSFQRLKSLQNIAKGQPAELFGVISDSEMLCRLAQERGCRSFLCAH